MLFRHVILAAVLAAMSTLAFADALTDRARQLLRDRQHRQAYELLLPQEPARAGDPEFDYLLGIAALDAGDPERAVFALERVLAMQPNNHVARAEIARAYMTLGEREAARREFETVRRQSIPDDAKASIDQYLSAISAADITQVQGLNSDAPGFQDNSVNSATSDSRIAIPGLGIVANLDPSSTSQDDLISNISGGVNLTHRLSEQWALVGGIGVATKIHASEGRFDTLSADGNAGVRYSAGKEAFTVGLQAQHFGLDFQRYRQAHGVVAQWQHNYTERRQASLFGQFTELHYPHQGIRDANRSVVGIAFGTALQGNWSPVIFLSAYGGEEREQSEGVPHLGHELGGIRLGGQLRIATGLALFSNFSYERREYGGEEPLFAEEREDDQADLAVGLSYLVRPATTFIAQVAHTQNQSNIPIFDFDRTVTTFALRFNF